MSVAAKTRVLEVLLVEGSLSAATLSLEAVGDGRTETNVRVVRDGAEALAFLRQRGGHSSAPRPAAILLDLDLPGDSGPRLLEEIKHDPDLKRIPVVVFSASRRAEDIKAAYSLHANCHIRKPANADQLVEVLELIEEFWLTRVRLPAA